MSYRQFPMQKCSRVRPSAGYTLMELIVAVGIFAIVMALASGAYLMIIDVNRQAQGITGGINNLSFALDEMLRDIRTGNDYCLGNTTCPTTSFQFIDQNGDTVTYSLANGAIEKQITYASGNGTVGPTIALTDYPQVNVTALTFHVTGQIGYGASGNTDVIQPRVVILISGTVSTGPGKTQPFTVETDATMRGTDL